MSVNVAINIFILEHILVILYFFNKNKVDGFVKNVSDKIRGKLKK